MNDQLLAWAPKSDPPHLLQLSSVLLSPNQPLPLDRVTYLGLLAGRVQQLVSRSPNPQETTDALVDQMLECCLLREVRPIRWQAAGPKLVSSNPLVHQRLHELAIYSALKFAQPREMPEARQTLQDDLQSPYSRLLDWASVLASH